MLLLPLFLRSEPLAPGALRTMAEELVARSGLHVSDIRLLLMSEKTTSANAAVVGLGPTRRILLGDTLTGDEADDGRLAESRAVLAHELAHHAHGDMWRGLALEAASSLLAWPVAAALLAQLPTALAHGGAGDPASLPAFALSFGVVSLPLGLVTAWHSRRRERAADAYAYRLADGESFARALERLVASNLGELVPPWLTQMRSSHPPSGERIAAARGRQPSPRARSGRCRPAPAGCRRWAAAAARPSRCRAAPAAGPRRSRWSTRAPTPRSAIATRPAPAATWVPVTLVVFVQCCPPSALRQTPCWPVRSGHG